MIAPILYLIGGILTLLSVLPVISDMLPLLSGSESGVTGKITFWGESVSAGGVTLTTHNVKSWTVLGLPPILMFLIFAILGLVAIVIGVDAFYKFLPDDLVGMPLAALVGLIVGIVELVVELLMYFGDSKGLTSGSANNFGFSPAVTGWSLGLGFILLLLSAILIIVGGILAFVFKPSSA